jgi:effector-binding domain-containing protein
MDMQDLDIEIGMPVPEPLPGQGDIEAGEIPAGQLAACVHTGPYEDIAPAYEALSAWMAQEGYEPTGVAYEVYLNDPGDTPPDELRTEVFYPLKED